MPLLHNNMMPSPKQRRLKSSVYRSFKEHPAQSVEETIVVKSLPPSDTASPRVPFLQGSFNLRKGNAFTIN